MTTSRFSKLNSTSLWVLITGLLLAAGHAALFQGEADTRVHIPAAQFIRKTLSLEGNPHPNLKILAGDLPSQSSPWNLAEPLRPAEWQQIFESLSQSPVRNLYFVHGFTDSEFATLNPSILGNTAFFGTFPSQEAPVSETLSTGQLQGARLFADPGSENSPAEAPHLQGPHSSFGQSVRYGHWGPWTPYSVWPVLKTDSSGEWQTSRQIILAGIPSLRLENDRLVLPNGTVSLMAGDRIGVLPLTPRELNTSLSSLREFLIDPKPFLSQLQQDDLVIVQERKLSADSGSFQEELAFNGGLASMMLSNKWLRNMPGHSLILILNILATLLCAFLLRPRPFFWVAAFALGIQIIAGPIVLIEYGYLTPWSHLAFVIAPAALIGSFFGMVRQSIDEQVIVRDLIPAFSLSEAQNIAPSVAGQEDFSAERLVSILDVNVVGFSKTIENTLTEETPHQISSFLASLMDIVHNHDGFISDHSPDRILAIFGHGLTKGDQTKYRNHVTRALACAEAIQNRSIELMHDMGVGVMPPFPVRCGINSSTVRIGLIKLTNRVEFRAIGAGLDLANQLASQCEAFRILMSDSSHELAKKEGITSVLERATARPMRVSETLTWCKAYEIDPFAADRDTLRQALEIYRSYNNIKREENRFTFPRGAEPMLESELGSFDVLDYSLTGLRLRSKRFIAAGSVITTWPAEFDASNTPYRLTFTVHWGSPDRTKNAEGDCYILGVRYLDNSESELEAFAQYFQEKFAESSEGVAPLSWEEKDAV